MSKVFVLDTNFQPLNPIHSGEARYLLKSQKAAVFRQYPFTIILQKSVTHPRLKPLRIKIDPGSRTTGLALVTLEGIVIWAAELSHRGPAIKTSLESRRSLRRGRRNRQTRYRQPRFMNRTRKEGWLPPSLKSRVDNILTWVERIRKVSPVNAISQELVRFDLQKLENPEISGVEYQQGTLFGYEVREYLLEKWQRQCAYCHLKNTPLQVEHIQPKAQGGSNRINNLCLACEKCNIKKGTKDILVFLKGQSELLKKILEQAKKPLKDATAVNATRWSLFHRLKETRLPVETGSGGMTKFNRIKFKLPKAHWIDAACIGASTPKLIEVRNVYPLKIRATGHGSRQMCRTDKFGFPVRYCPRTKIQLGFQTGDLVQANIPSGKYQGEYTGRITIRTRPSFSLKTSSNKFDVNPKYLRTIHKADGYDYASKEKRIRSSSIY